MQEGDASEGNVKTVAGPNGTMISSASTTGTVDKLATPPAVDLRQIVWGSIANGMDPVDAARMFGPWTIEDQVHATPAQLAHAQNPLTYGWTCHS
jgi:hypothetical protein